MIGFSFVAFWLFLTGISVLCLFRERMKMKEIMKMEELLSQERSSAKPLIKENQYDYDYRRHSSSDEEQTIGSFESKMSSSHTVSTKSTATKAHTFDNPQKDDAMSTSLNTQTKSSSKPKRKSTGSLTESDAKSLASAKGEAKSSRGFKVDDDLLSVAKSTSSKQSTVLASAKGGTKSSRSSKVDEDLLSVAKSTTSKRSTVSAEESKQAPTKAKRKTVSSVDPNKNSMSKSKTKSSSSRDYKKHDDSRDGSKRSSGRSRHTTTSKSMLDKLNSFDIV
jgi:hypothetical protein